ncbi:MAG TPA: hypothetical protein VGO96_02635 [Pyrinomonadaceae bacterium]|nr:hypothetical protein [Pyrinomonadaceae bacterium]
MLKLRWPRGKKTGETVGDAQGDATGEAAAGVEAAATPGDVAGATDEARLVTDEVRLRASLEVIKTAVVWLVVVNILTVLSPLLWLPLKWSLAVGVLLTLGSVVIGGVAYLRARGIQRRLPE